MKYNYRFTKQNKISIKLSQKDITKFKFWKLTDICELPNKNKVIISGKNYKGDLIPVYEIKKSYIRGERYYKLSWINSFGVPCEMPHLTMLFKSLREAILKGCDTGLSFYLQSKCLRDINNELKKLNRPIRFYESNDSVKVFADTMKEKIHYTITRTILTRGNYIGDLGYQAEFVDSGKIYLSKTVKNLYEFIKQTEVN